MRLDTMLAERQLTMSFEVFPPKADTPSRQVTEAALEIAALQPSFVSVTYGAGGSTSRSTVALAEELRRQSGVEVLAHLTCVDATRAGAAAQIAALRDAGIENVMALRGDLPAERDETAKPDFHYAVDLVRLLRAEGCFCVGGACYPERHPDSPTLESDLAHLKEKVDAGCSFLTTQMFFDNSILYSFLFKAREAGITVPVLAGIMPITTARQIDRVVRLSNASLPRRFRSLLDRFGSSPEAMKQAGIAYATDQIIDLYANGVSHVHLYTMNKPDVAAAIQRNLSEMLGMRV